MSNKYSEQYIRGVGTSELVGQRHETVARHINAVLIKRKAIANDLTRTDDEKAVLYKRLADEYGKVLKESTGRLAVDLSFVQTRINDMRTEARGKMSVTEAVSLIAALRQAGVAGDDLKTAAINDVRVAQALANAPDAVLTAAKWNREQADEMLMRHFPDIAVAEKQAAADYAAYDRLESNVNETIAEINKRAPARVLSTRVDEKDLFNTSLPEPKTAAEEAQRREELAATQERLGKQAESTEQGE